MQFFKATPDEAKAIRDGCREFVVAIDAGGITPRPSDELVFFCHPENFIASTYITTSKLIRTDPLLCRFQFELNRPLEETCG